MKDLNVKLLKKASEKKALIWDFDGVLCFLNWDHGVDVDKWWDEGFGKIFQEFEKEISFKKSSETDFWEENVDFLLSKYGEPAEKKINRFFLDKETEILPYSKSNTEVLEIITGLDPKTENFIWSNNQIQTLETFIKEKGLAGKFKTIISRGPRGYVGKPDVTAFEKIKVLTNTSIDDFMFIGDSVYTDKIVAAKLGMDFFHYKEE